MVRTPFNSNDNDLGRSVSIVGTLYNEEDEFTRDELSKQAVIPCQNAIFPGRQNHYDGIECSKPSINREFDDFGGKREDNTNHVRSVGSQWGTNVNNNTHQPGYSDGKGKGNTGTRTVLSESSKKIQFLYEQLGPLLRVNTPGGNARDEFDDGHGYRNNLPITIDTIMKPNRCYIANSLGYKIYDKDQEDYIKYIKEEFNCYIEEVMEYGFDHIIIIGQQNCGILFLDCFGRVFNLDGMSSTLVFHGDYLEGVERVTKGFELKWMRWIIESDTGNIVVAAEPVEADYGPMHS
ncbi:unnamed protein product [Rhizophagus irregularis]|nr:unnamed protein product [Rhizophagus irregularis]